MGRSLVDQMWLMRDCSGELVNFVGLHPDAQDEGSKEGKPSHIKVVIGICLHQLPDRVEPGRKSQLPDGCILELSS